MAVAALGLASLCVAAGCESEPDYFKFTYNRIPKGLTLVCKHEDGTALESGTEIREGYRVNFTLVQDKFCTGNPVVRLNGQIIQPVDGVYSFVMEKDSAIVVDETSVTYEPHYTVEFSKGVDDRIWYEYGGNQVEGGFKAEFAVGEEVEFKLRTSVYYSTDFEVYANTEEVKKKEGTSDTYSFICTDDTVISVYGLETGEDFYAKLQKPYNAKREELSKAYDAAFEEKGDSIKEKYAEYLTAETKNDTAKMDEIAADPDMADIVEKRKAFVVERDKFDAMGKSKEKPFLITTPVDLYAMAFYINNSFNTGLEFQTAYYKMENDIDLCGEQMFIIGDAVNDTAAFCGSFDGGGHTVKNFYMEDYVVDQESGVNLYLPYIGMFGYLTAVRDHAAPSVRNLKLENATIDVDAGRHISATGDSRLHVGMLAGAATGTTFSGCSADGNLRLNGNNSVFSTAGGLIGYAETIVSGNTELPIGISACASSVSIQCANRVWAAGGILGYAITAEPNVNVTILNSCTSGNVVGAVNTGGIVGHMNDNASVTNCYSSGSIVAGSTYSASGSVDNDRFCYANAGGIAGYAQANTVIANCFSVGRISAIALAGERYQKADDICGSTVSDGEDYADARAVVIFNCEKNGTNVNQDYIKTTLGWNNVAAWKFGEDLLPVPDPTATNSSFTITIDLGGESVTEKTSITADEFRPMSYWYQAHDGIEEYLSAASGKRTYGYYFDAAGTMRVPVAYVPTTNITLYAKFANYYEVGGTYYFKAQDGAYITLKEDGTYLFGNGALTEEGSYTYDGQSLMLLDSCLAHMSEASTSFYYTSFKAVKEGNTLSFTEPVFFPQGDLVAVMKSEGFVCGNYYDADGNEYAFFENGNGVRVVGANVTAFTYTVDGDEFSVQLSGGAALGGTLSSGVPTALNGVNLTAYDAFNGVWRKQMSTREEYVFDGKSSSGSGTWTYHRYLVGADGKITLNESATQTGSYTVTADVLTASGDQSFTARFDENGLLKITKGGVSELYGANEGYIGKWRFPNQTEPVTIELKGLNAEGVGKATLTFENSDSDPYELRYEVLPIGATPVICLYWGSIGFGELRFVESSQDASTALSKVRSTLEGNIYSERLGDIRVDSTAVFYLEDNFFGAWQGSDGDFFKSVNFNGKGYYDLPRGASHMAVSGSVNVVVSDPKTFNVAYSVAQGTEEGKFTLTITEAAGEGKTHKYSVEYSIRLDGEDLVISYVGGYEGTRTDLKGTHVLHRPAV